MTTPKMSAFQFMVSNVMSGSGEIGKKIKIQTVIRKANAPMLQRRPSFPIDQRLGGRGPRKRRMMRQVKLI